MSLLRRHGFTEAPSWDLVRELAAEIRDSISPMTLTAARPARTSVCEHESWRRAVSMVRVAAGEHRDTRSNKTKTVA